MFHSYWRQKGALLKKIHICVIEVTPMTFQEIPNINKDTVIAESNSESNKTQILFQCKTAIHERILNRGYRTERFDVILRIVTSLVCIL